MPFLLRVELPDVPGSLGRLASAIGEAGGDIEAIEIVDKDHGIAVDDVVLELPPGTMPDSVVSAVTSLEGVTVLWISRYAAGGQLFLDLEIVESMTEQPDSALERLVDLMPDAFRVDWAGWCTDGAWVRVTGAAPTSPPSVDGLVLATHLDEDGETVRCALPLADGGAMVLARRGGPEFLNSELARITHLIALAGSISR